MAPIAVAVGTSLPSYLFSLPDNGVLARVAKTQNPTSTIPPPMTTIPTSTIPTIAPTLNDARVVGTVIDVGEGVGMGVGCVGRGEGYGVGAVGRGVGFELGDEVRPSQ